MGSIGPYANPEVSMTSVPYGMEGGGVSQPKSLTHVYPDQIPSQSQVLFQRGQFGGFPVNQVENHKQLLLLLLLLLFCLSQQETVSLRLQLRTCVGSPVLTCIRGELMTEDRPIRSFKPRRRHLAAGFHRKLCVS
ncbi:Hypothetical predicted protein [Xyrichtys novacula]|uniref:Uncharacterized protein n=1 Tax=Xyrichtys novacula TaxID=13765 RepID=A0AAV1FE96_XYRNO|nr:Hypothetical predicted protein [Xyrichtys novacula]